VFAGRLVAVTFCVLSIFLIYEFTSRLYNQKTAFLSAVLFSIMPGMVWLSRMAMIETLLIFVFTLCLLYFYSWLTTGRERDRKISIVLLAIGVAVKYQTLVIVPFNNGAWYVHLEKNVPKKPTKKLLPHAPNCIHCNGIKRGCGGFFCAVIFRRSGRVVFCLTNWNSTKSGIQRPLPRSPVLFRGNDLVRQPHTPHFTAALRVGSLRIGAHDSAKENCGQIPSRLVCGNLSCFHPPTVTPIPLTSTPTVPPLTATPTPDAPTPTPLSPNCQP
jgi:hypothetical protein